MTMLPRLRVLELGFAWAGPLAGRWLADLGAEVIKVEQRTARGLGVAPDTLQGTGGVAGSDPGWTWGSLPGPAFRSGIYPDADPGERPWNRAGIFNKMNRNKRSLCIDLKSAAGAAVFRELVRVSDIVLDNFSTRALTHLGLTYAELAAVNPRIICASLSGYGREGPYGDRVSYGPILEAHSGLVAMTGYADRDEPVKLGAAFPDAIGGLTGTYAILAALWERELTGRGTLLDMSQLEAYAALAGPELLATTVTGEAPRLHGNRSESAAPQSVYPCAGDDAWLTICVRSDAEWPRLVEALDLEELRDPALCEEAERHRRHDRIDTAIANWTRQRNKYAAMQELQAAGIAAVAVLTNADLVEDPQIAARGFMVEVDQPDVGVRRFPGFPVHFAATPRTEFRGAPSLGGDNASILRDLLGYPVDAVQQLQESGVIAESPV